MEKLTQTKETQAAMSPAQSLQQLKDGNQRFSTSQPTRRDYMAQVEGTASGQYPFAIVLGCVDSRVPPEVVFDQGIGDIFSARIAGNFVNEDILGSMEFATKVAGAKLIVVLGHSQCGAIMGAADDAQLGNLTGMLAKLKPAVEAVQGIEGVRTSENPAFIEAVVKKNVEMTVEAIQQRSQVLREMLEAGAIKLVGAHYDVGSGEVTFTE